MYIYTYIHTYIHTYIWVYGLGLIYVYIYIYIYIYMYIYIYTGKRVFITNVKGTFLGMSESEEASKRRISPVEVPGSPATTVNV